MKGRHTRMPVPIIQLRIVRDNANSLKDEIFTISRGAAHNDWRINHKSNFSQSNTVMFVKSRSDVLDYLENISELLKVDNEPFHYLQFDIPCYPVTLVPRCDVLMRKDTLDKIMRVVEDSLDNWPAWVEEWST